MAPDPNLHAPAAVLPRRTRIAAVSLTLAALGLAGACRNGGRVVGPEELPGSPVIMSDPVSTGALAGAGAALSLSATSETDVVYVSLSPGTIPDGELATVRNLRTGSAVAATMSAGGFDPVPLEATVGDTVELVVRDGSGVTVLTARTAVAASRRPVVVRTDPPPRKRDVPLNTVIVIVFSEPVARSTVTASTVQLLSGATPVPGTVELVDATNLVALFRPASSLSPNTQYRLLVTQEVRDLDGDALEEAVTVEFTTGTSPTTGAVRVTVTTSGADLDPDGYSVTVDGGIEVDGAIYHFLGVNDVVTLSDLGTGDHYVTLLGVASNCGVSGSNPDSVTVTPGDTADIAFAVTCDLTGGLQVTVATTGVDPDPNGYSVRVTGAGFDTPYDLAANGTVSVSMLVPGDYSVTLRDAAANCDVTSPNPATVALVGGNTVAVAFAVTCAPVTRLAVVGASGDGGFVDIYVVNSNGTGLARLTTDPGYDASPAWSPDRSKIAFMSLRDGNGEIYVMNADGSSQERLTIAATWDQFPAWSPDGTRIAFVSYRDGNAEIYVMNADGTNPVRLTDHPADDQTPDWSPDGRQIAFASNRDGHYEIYVMNADGPGLTRLTSNPSNPDPRLQITTTGPDWSPDGTKLAFMQGICDQPYGCDYDIYVMNVDGSQVTQLTSSAFGASMDAHWSPDGRRIAFTAVYCDDTAGAGSCDNWYNVARIMRADGTDAVDLTVWGYHSPAWRW